MHTLLYSLKELLLVKRNKNNHENVLQLFYKNTLSTLVNIFSRLIFRAKHTQTTNKQW